jgi:hypothetical protein
MAYSIISASHQQKGLRDRKQLGAAPRKQTRTTLEEFPEVEVYKGVKPGVKKAGFATEDGPGREVVERA